MNSTETTRTLVIERVFPHPPQKLWRALTESPLIAQWLMSNDFEPAVGRRFKLQSQPVPNWDGVINCEVLAVEPITRLSYSWGTMGMESVVAFALTPTEGGTHLRMEHSGFGPDQDHAYKGAKYGWTNFLNGMERVLAGLE
jgi:uncharacterized protein YndB with AHSA1/START domain